jgi:hypothetical protein
MGGFSHRSHGTNTKEFDSKGETSHVCPQIVPYNLVLLYTTVTFPVIAGPSQDPRRSLEESPNNAPSPSLPPCDFPPPLPAPQCHKPALVTDKLLPGFSKPLTAPHLSSLTVHSSSLLHSLAAPTFNLNISTKVPASRPSNKATTLTNI